MTNAMLRGLLAALMEKATETPIAYDIIVQFENGKSKQLSCSLGTSAELEEVQHVLNRMHQDYFMKTHSILRQHLGATDEVFTRTSLVLVNTQLSVFNQTPFMDLAKELLKLSRAEKSLTKGLTAYPQGTFSIEKEVRFS